MRKFARIHSRSVFARLLLIMLLMAVALNVIVYRMQFKSKVEGESTISRSLVRYVHYLAEDLGTPPDRGKAERLAEELNMRIRLEGAETWVVGEGPPEEELERFHSIHVGDMVKVSASHGYYRIRLLRPGGERIIFDFSPTESERERFRMMFLGTIGLVCLVLMVAYGMIRRQLMPVRWLAAGAAKVRDGDLGHRVPVVGRGELADLSSTFNEMAGSMERTVDAQRRLLLDVGHELRTPITRMKLQLEMLEKSERAESMGQDLREMEAMVNAVLESARLRHVADSLVREDVDLGALAVDVARRFEGREPGVSVRLPEEAPKVRVAPDKIATVLSNLLDNALKYSPPDGAQVELALSFEPDVAVVTVRDRGEGIPAEDLPHLFEPFYRVDRSRARETGGFGLGLSLCYEIVRAHGGSIKLDSVPNAGTTAIVRLPQK